MSELNVALLQSTRGDTSSHVSEHNSNCFPGHADNTIARVKDQQCETAGNTTDDAEWMRNDAALSLVGLPTGQLLNWFCDHHELLDYTSRFVHG